MPIGPRNAYLAFGIVLCLATGVLGQTHDKKDIQRADQKPETQAQAQAKPAAPIAPIKTVPPAERSSAAKYKPDCDSPNSREDADLCEQRRMAKAAEETVEATRDAANWARNQFWATIGEIVALVLTILIAMAAVIAAFRSNRIARESAERQLRAYVGVFRTTIDWSVVGAPRATIHIRNDGQTPAYNLTHWMAIGLSDKADLKNLHPPTKLSKSDLGPNVPMSIAQTKPLTQQQITALQTGQLRLFVWGMVNYNDAFGQIDRWVKYRLVLAPAGLAGNVENTLDLCEEGNESN